MKQAEPDVVAAARRNADRAGFVLSSDAGTGRLLAVLAAAVPDGGAILELGTGLGVGTAWLVSGLGERRDARVVTVESDADVSASARANHWPDFVEFVVGDAVALLPGLGSFDLIFADAQGGKWSRLDLTISALRPGGFLVVDDMTPQDGWSQDHRAENRKAADTILGHPDLVACGLEWSTGVIVGVRSRA